MEQPSSDELTIRHQFDRICHLALEGEAVNYYKYMDYRRKHEVCLSELSEKELSRLFTMDQYEVENYQFRVLDYDVEVKWMQRTLTIEYGYAIQDVRICGATLQIRHDISTCNNEEVLMGIEVKILSDKYRA